MELCEALLELGPEVPDEALDGPGGAVGQGADGVALDLLRQLPQHVDLLGLRVALDWRRSQQMSSGEETNTEKAEGTTQQPKKERVQSRASNIKGEEMTTEGCEPEGTPSPLGGKEKKVLVAKNPHALDDQREGRKGRQTKARRDHMH